MTVKASTQAKTRETPSKQAIRRAVASSTAIGTGQSITSIKRKLHIRSGKYRHASLAQQA